MYDLLRAITEDAGVRPQVRSSNPDIEAAIRRDPEPAFLVVVAHEPAEPKTTVTVGFGRGTPKRLIDVANGEALPFEVRDNELKIDLNVPNGTTRLLKFER